MYRVIAVSDKAAIIIVIFRANDVPLILLIPESYHLVHYPLCILRLYVFL